MSLNLYSRGNRWWVIGSLKDPATDRSEDFRHSTGLSLKTTSRKVAEDYVANLEREFYNGGRAATQKAELTFGKLADDYRKDRTNPLGATSDAALYKLATHWKQKPVDEINSKTVRAVAKVLYPNAGSQTWNRAVVGVVRSVLTHAAGNDDNVRLPVLKTFERERSKPKVKKTPVTQEWCQAFIANASDPYLKALALFLFQTGARVGDATSLDWSQVDLVKRRVTYLIGKTQVVHVAKLPVEAFEAIAALPAPHAGLVFGWRDRFGPRTAWETVCRKLVTLGLPRLTYHCCRHGFATFLASQGVPPADIAKAGGWLSVGLVAEVYCHATDEAVSDKLSWRGAAQKQAAKKAA